MELEGKIPKGKQIGNFVMYVTVQEKNKLQVYSSANIKALKNYLLSQKPCLIFYRPFTCAYCLWYYTWIHDQT